MLRLRRLARERGPHSLHAVRAMNTASLASLIAEHGMIRIGVAPYGRRWTVTASTMRGRHLATLEGGFAKRIEASDRAEVLRHRAAAMAPNVPIEARDPVSPPAPVDREAAIRLAIGILRDLERVIPSPRIAEALALLSH